MTIEVVIPTFTLTKTGLQSPKALTEEITGLPIIEVKHQLVHCCECIHFTGGGIGIFEGECCYFDIPTSEGSTCPNGKLATK